MPTEHSSYCPTVSSTRVAFIIVLVFCGSLIGQQRTVDEASYNAHLRAASSFRLSEKYSAKHVSDICESENCSWKESHISVIEYDPPKKMRSYMINTSRGEAEPSTVVIFIDGKQYSKRGNLEWKEELPPPPSPTEPSSEIIGAEFKDHGMENVGLNAMRVLEKIVRSRDKRDPDGKENVQHIKSWIDAAGRLSKQEFTFKRADKRWSRLTIYYEIDPTINIETPIKPKKN